MDERILVFPGVGFIALFGIAVLNGIVLIEHLKIKTGRKVLMNSY
jgi:Cu/Ag efflux pump CusA